MYLMRNLLKRSNSSKFILQSVSNRFFSAACSNHNGPRRRPTTTDYDNLIYEAGSSGDFDGVRRLLNRRMTDACFNSKDTFKFLTNTTSYSSVLEELRRTLAQTDGGFTRKHAYDTLVARLCKLNRVGDALIVINDMIQGRYGTTVCSVHPILNTLTKKNKMEEAWRVVELMRSHALPPDATAYNYFLTSYCYDGDMVNASKVMRKIEEEGLTPDTRTYDALVLGACKAGKVEAAMVILRRMEDDKIPILYATHAHVITEMVKRRYYEEALKYVLAYAGKDGRLDAESLGGLATKLLKDKRLEEAKVVVKEMVKRRVTMGRQLREFYESHVKDVHFD